MAQYKVCIDPGHGGSPSTAGGDPGAIGPSGLKEKDVNLSVATLVANKLRTAGVNVKLTRTGDFSLELQDRCNIANSFDADFFVSIHCNSSTSSAAHGTETYCYKLGGKGEMLAEEIQKELVKATGLTNRGVKTANYYVLRKTNMPAALTELAFISNPAEEKLLARKDFQEKCAGAIAKGISNLLNIKLIAEVLSMFKDVPKEHWAAESIDKLSKLGILKGDDNGNFRPNEPLTRAEAAVVIDRVLKYLGR